jgi:hypothetical protein
MDDSPPGRGLVRCARRPVRVAGWVWMRSLAGRTQY